MLENMGVLYIIPIIWIILIITQEEKNRIRIIEWGVTLADNHILRVEKSIEDKFKGLGIEDKGGNLDIEENIINEETSTSENNSSYELVINARSSSEGAFKSLSSEDSEIIPWEDIMYDTGWMSIEWLKERAIKVEGGIEIEKTEFQVNPDYNVLRGWRGIIEDLIEEWEYLEELIEEYTRLSETIVNSSDFTRGLAHITRPEESYAEPLEKMRETGRRIEGVIGRIKDQIEKEPNNSRVEEWEERVEKYTGLGEFIEKLIEKLMDSLM